MSGMQNTLTSAEMADIRRRAAFIEAFLNPVDPSEDEAEPASAAPQMQQTIQVQQTVQLQPALQPQQTIQLQPALQPQQTIQIHPAFQPQQTIQIHPAFQPQQALPVQYDEEVSEQEVSEEEEQPEELEFEVTTGDYNCGPSPSIFYLTAGWADGRDLMRRAKQIYEQIPGSNTERCGYEGIMLMHGDSTYAFGSDARDDAFKGWVKWTEFPPRDLRETIIEFWAETQTIECVPLGGRFMVTAVPKEGACLPFMATFCMLETVHMLAYRIVEENRPMGQSSRGLRPKDTYSLRIIRDKKSAVVKGSTMLGDVERWYGPLHGLSVELFESVPKMG